MEMTLDELKEFIENMPDNTMVTVQFYRKDEEDGECTE